MTADDVSAFAPPPASPYTTRVIDAKRTATLAISVIFLLVGPAQTQEDPSPHLEALLADVGADDGQTSTAALNGIIALGESTAPRLEPLISNLDVPARVRSGVVFCLGRIGAESSKAPLRALWEQGFEGLGGALAIQTAIALSEFGEFDALEAIVAAGDDVLAAKAGVQLGLHGAEVSLPVLQSAFANEAYQRLQVFFAISLGLLGDERGADLLAAAVRTPELRNHCAIALGKIGRGNEVVFELEFAMSDPDPLVRLAALEVLIELERSGLQATVETALSDADARVRAAAERAHRRLTRRNRRR